MRIIFITFLIFFNGLVLSQEKFLELTVFTKDDDKLLKNFDVFVTCEEGVDFTLTSKKKKLTFYLSAGLDYKIIVTKKGFYQTIYEIDLTDVPSALYQDNFLAHDLTAELVPKSKPQPTIIHQLFYETRYGKLKNK